MSNTVFKIECVVRYDETSVFEGFEHVLQKSVDRAIQHGMLTPTGEEIVDEYSMEIQHAKEEIPGSEQYRLYAKYITDNLPRTTRGGWEPVCFEEFISSEEFEGYLCRLTD